MKIDEVIKSKFNSPQHRAIVNLRYTANYLAHIQNKQMLQFDISIPQFNILRILRGAGGQLNINEIKNRMVDRSPNTTRLLDKLVEKELISRVRCEEDKRIYFAEIKTKGIELLSKIDEEFDSSSMAAIDLTDDEASVLSDLLDKLRTKYE